MLFQYKINSTNNNPPIKMSLNNNSKQGFSMVVKEPQNGKTGICIDFIMKSIAQDKRTNMVHIVLTMNKLTASSQFVSRIEDKILPEQIVAFNSKSQKGENFHAKTMLRSTKIYRI